MNVNYDELIIVAGGAFLAVFGFGKWNEYKKILVTGKRVEGVVFDMENTSDMTSISFDNDSSGRNGLHYPIIRYVTLEKEWVTKKYSIGSNPSPYNIGDTVNIVYDTNDIEHFIIDDNQSRFIWPIVMIVGVALIVGVSIYFFINQYPSLR
ncbi:DUF3592 domain-containing protein [Mucilaginibacter sp. BJC16-A38]|uniref:DUF3592 domain-containing protein n=1 Tax=Mucilaginibacter phenanthrenivorans TaxID=1234842 RepID=UPI00215731EC|nr:DUF3592 domain-containing protein [Mucilaginibacter phenanthrenivorans]MCR8560498.1 DUF3592 domain-containing protein [Mucilaginibacter phenanthrenivorans]